MPKKLPWTASALALAVSSALAQNVAPTGAPSASSYQLAYLDPVVVTASRFEQNLADVPAFAQVITKEEIVQSGATSVSEAVNKIGNINVRSLAGGPLGILADIDMRGFGASARDNTLILVDGMRVSPIDSGSISWESIPISNVERIEIIHGGGSVQFGDKAVGGVINIITRGDLTRPSTAAVTFGSYGTVMTNASLITGWGNTRAKLDVVADSTDGWRDNSQARQGMAKGLLSHSLGGQDKIFAEALISYQQYHFPGGVVGEVNTGDRRAAKFNNIGDKTTTNGSRGLVGLAKSFGDGWQFLAEAAYTDSRATQLRPYYATDGNAGTAGEIIYSKWSYDLTPRLKKVWNPSNDSVFGLDYQKASANYKPDIGDQKADRQDATVENKSVYLFHKYLVTNQLELNGGVRRQVQSATAFEKYTLYDWDGVTVSSVGANSSSKRQTANAADFSLSYRFNDAYKDRVFLRSNRAFRFANTDEFWGCETDPSSFTCSRRFKGILRPQKADTLELGTSLAFNQSTRMSASVFQINTTDEIRYDATADIGNGANINAPKIRRQGMSLQLRHSVSRQMSINSALTWQQTEYVEGIYSGKEVPLVPRTTAVIGVSYETSPSLFYRLNLNYVGSQRYMDDDENSKNRMPAYTVVDLGARYREKSWEFDFQLKNLTDRKYATYGGYTTFLTVAPGKYLLDAYYYYPGDPRTLWLSARYRFN